MNKIILYVFLLGFIIVGISSCKKNNVVVDQNVVPPSFAKFNTLLAADTIGKFYVRSTNNVFKIPVGITTVSDKSRTIQLAYTSRTAVQGTQYNGPATIVIPAGKVLDSLSIQGLFAGYPTTTRVDTVKIQITGGDVPANAYKNTYYVIMRKYCDVNPNDFLGVYAHTNEFFSSAYGPYTTTVLSVTPVAGSTTQARIVVDNIYDYGWNPITFTMDWTDPANFVVTPVTQTSGIADASTLNPAYAGYQVSVQPFSGSPGTFSSCDQTITLKMQLGVTGLGTFANVYTVTMAR